MHRFRLGSRRSQSENHNGTKSSPTAEDILDTIDKFGEQENSESSPETWSDGNHNNHEHSRGSSIDASYDFGDIETLGISQASTYGLEWERLFTKDSFKNVLRNLAMEGNLRSCRFRSVCWKLFLEVLPENRELWINKTRQWRKKYEELKKNLITNPRQAADLGFDLNINNPLSQSEESPWNQFFQDNELRLTIKQDVIRTFPEVQFFQNPELRNQMVDLLFIYSKSHYVVSYKQGMHELLAPLIFVLHCDHQAFLHASEVETLQDIIKEVMDPKFLEHDAYAMFSQIMETVEPWYWHKDTVYSKSREVINKPFCRPCDLNSSNAIVSKLTRVQDYILKKCDFELYSHLERLEIAPQIYGIRWLRLLFGREFPMQDLLVLWDALFSDGIGFDLVDYIFVAMLLYIRDLLLGSDYPQCLTCLMRYPPVPDIHYLIEGARHIREPSVFPRPPKYSYLDKNVNFTGSGKAPTPSEPKPSEQSKASPQFPVKKRGSSASLSQVEDSVFPSANSMARLDSNKFRSTDNSPMTHSAEETNGSVSMFATLPRARKKDKKKAQREAELIDQVGVLQSDLYTKESMCRYCATKLDIHINRLQNTLQRQRFQDEDEIWLAIAGVKQVRDVLKGVLKFSENLGDELDFEPIKITDDYYSEEEPSCNHGDSDTKGNNFKNKKFYLTSGENSGAANSNQDGTNKTDIVDINTSVEMSDYLPSSGRHYSKSLGVNDKHNIPESSYHSDSQRNRSVSSPNPLYRYHYMGEEES